MPEQAWLYYSNENKSWKTDNHISNASGRSQAYFFGCDYKYQVIIIMHALYLLTTVYHLSYTI